MTYRAVASHRRYCLLKSQAALDAEDFGLEAAWRGKQAAIDGTDLPATFPYRTLLISAGYSVKQDIIGADVDELKLRVSGLTKSGAVAVIEQALLI